METSWQKVDSEDKMLVSTIVLAPLCVIIVGSWSLIRRSMETDIMYSYVSVKVCDQVVQ